MTMLDANESDRVTARKIYSVFIFTTGLVGCLTSSVFTAGWVMTAGIAGIQPVTLTREQQQARDRAALRHRLALGGSLAGSAAIIITGLYVWPRPRRRSESPLPDSPS